MYPAATGDYDTIQINYNLLERGPAERLIAAAAGADVGVLIKQPLAMGWLTSKYLHLPLGERVSVKLSRLLVQQQAR